MRVVLQRVSEASVSIDGTVVGEIHHGLLILLGIAGDDGDEDIEYLVHKINAMRIFSDPSGKMNWSIHDAQGQFLVVSQFTLFASTKKGNRPGFTKSAHPTVAIPLYNQFVDALKRLSGLDVQTGKFGADMKVKLLNDGPVTIVMDSKNRE
jgi:D-tyrosyl-tRNA(Tyr) deacylase